MNGERLGYILNFSKILGYSRFLKGPRRPYYNPINRCVFFIFSKKMPFPQQRYYFQYPSGL